MKKVLMIIGIVFLLPIIGFSFYIIDWFYYSAIDDKAENAAIHYFEEKYNEKFVISEVSYSRALGDDYGMYDLVAHPQNSPGIEVDLQVSEEFEIIREDYKESKWGYEVREEYIQMVEPLFPKAGHIWAHGSFTEEISDRYGIQDTYQTIVSENQFQSFESVKLLIFEEPAGDEKQLASIYQLWQHIQERNIRDYRIDISYYPEKLLNSFKTINDSNQFENENRKQAIYFCSITSSQTKTNPISTAEDIEKYCRVLK
jgi:hypothetical protein